MSMIGFIGLFCAFAAALLGATCSIAAGVMRSHGSGSYETLGSFGRVAAGVSCLAITLCCGVIVYCFFSGDISLDYVVRYRSNSESDLAWLYLLSGLWAGREGSLLFWAWLISLFDAYVALRHRASGSAVDECALGISQLVLLAFLGVLLFSESNMPFTPLSPGYVDANGQLTGGAQAFGLNSLLEHWAMAIHPPTLFVGYAGLTLPFAYALAAFALGDDSATWVEHVNGITAVAWLFLGIGIGLGAVWAYVVLGWGGYWGWDPVENASLLSWLACVALMHSFTLYRQRGQFKRWSVVCACFSFMFVIVGTFISRSGVVQSVHAFEGDNVSLVLFGALILVAFAAGLVGALGRRKSFAVEEREGDEDASFISRDMAYYLNNVLMMVGAFLLAYLTVSSALPTWLPLGGQSLTSGTYNAIARPLGIVLLLVMAVCPLLGWRRTDPARFRKLALVPGICALVVFGVLMAHFVTVLVPSYHAALGAGTTAAADLAAEGPSWYYNGLAAVGFLVASLLFFNSLFMLARFLRGGVSNLRGRLSAVGGFVAHAALGIILVGLIGSSMYVTQATGYLAGSEKSEAAESLQVGEYEVRAVDSNTEKTGDDYLYTLDLEVSRGEEHVASLLPAVFLDSSTMQRKYEAAVVSYPLHDLFAVYRGVNDNDDYSVDIRINPLIGFVWAGFALLMLGTGIGMFARRSAPARAGDENGEQEIAGEDGAEDD